MAVAVLVMHFPVAEEVGKQDWRMRHWPGVFRGMFETWEAAQEGGSRGAAEIVDAASRGLVLSAKLFFLQIFAAAWSLSTWSGGRSQTAVVAATDPAGKSAVLIRLTPALLRFRDADHPWAECSRVQLRGRWARIGHPLGHLRGLRSPQALRQGRGLRPPDFPAGSVAAATPAAVSQSGLLRGLRRSRLRR